MGQMVSVTTIQLYYCSAEAATGGCGRSASLTSVAAAALLSGPLCQV